MELKEIRKEIDKIDEQLLPLFIRRMECAKKVAEVKSENDTSVLNEKRERKILDDVCRKSGEYGGEAKILFSALMAMSRALQHKLLGGGAPLRDAVRNAAAAPPKVENVACLGQKGSFSHEAMSRLYPNAKPLFFSAFPDIFTAVENGQADLGVVPVENSSAGSVGEVYDLILKYRFSIVGEVSLPICNCLASRESDIHNIQIVYSHSQPLLQCSEYISVNKLKVKPHSSTSAAAQAAQSSGIGAICSENAAAEYGLNILARNIQNSSGNRTRFIVISRGLCIPENASKISLCFSLPHRTGTLYAVLAQFAQAGLNLTKIESRLIPDKNFEYDFYLDFSGNIHNAETLDLICSLYDELPRFSFLGNYTQAEE